MIVHELNTIFIHIPKTAGVSLTHAIISHIVGYDTSGEIGHLSSKLKICFDLRGKQKHKQARYYVPEDISKKLWDKYYKFTFVRNPWDRVVSEFHWRHSLSKRHPPKDFKKFIDYCADRLRRKQPGEIYWPHAQTQKSFVTNKSGNIIVDDIFYFEDINNAVSKISTKIGIPLDVKKYNTSNHKVYREYYNNETRDMVQRLYDEDIKLFGYKF